MQEEVEECGQYHHHNHPLTLPWVLNVDCKLKKPNYHHQRWWHYWEHYPQQDLAKQVLDQFALKFPNAVLALGLHFDGVAEVDPPSLDGVQSH